MSATVEIRYRYRLRVSNAQAVLLQALFNACRFVWNQALGRWEDLWRYERISLGYADADRELTDWRSRFAWLAEQPSMPQQQVLRDLYRAIAAFSNRTNPAGRPRFKSRKAGYATARWTNTPAALVVRVVGSVRVGRGPGGGAAIVTRPARSQAGWVWSTPGRPAAGGPRAP
jgi:transposase